MRVTIARVIGFVFVATFCVGVALTSGHASSNATVNGITVKWGDGDCNGTVDPIDALKILKTDAGIPPTQTVPGCPDFGSTVTLGVGLGVTFGDGTWRVGADIPPGLYRNSNSSAGCHFAFGGTPDEIIVIHLSIQTVQIKPGDVGFTSQGCGTWSDHFFAPSSGPTQLFGAGEWIVGTEIAPGLWRNTNSSGGCYWARLSDFGATVSAIIANYFGSSIQTVQITGSDVGFESYNCGIWTKIG
jgi:hypothetical protein